MDTCTPKQAERSSINRRHGAYLPHWTLDCGWYAVTFRLWDSVPKHVIEAWLLERKIIVKTAEQLKRTLSDREERRLAHLYSERIERYLDAGHGSSFMKDDRVAELVKNALQHFDGQRYALAAWCVMPNHVHVVMQTLGGTGLSDILHSWKSFSSKEANKLLNRSGEFWQAEYYDHLIRNDADFRHAVRYVLDNPTKAGLKNWKWVSLTECGRRVLGVT